MAVDKKVIKRRKTATSKEPQKSRPERQLHRLKQAVEKETGGAKSICLKCHQSFNQVWMSQYEKYSNFDMCPTCRMEKARAQADANANDGVRQAILPYTPHPGQQLVHASNAKFKVLSCLPPGEIILGTNKNIEDLTSEDFVFGHNGQVNRILGTMNRDYNGDVYEINARYIIPFTVTDEHPILLTQVTRNDNFEAYKKGHRPKKTVWSITEQKWVKASEVATYFEQQDTYHKWCLRIPRLQPGTNITEWKLRELKCCKTYYRPSFPINKETAWAIGLFVAEGNISRSVITYNLGIHEHELIDRVKKIFTDLGYHVSERITEADNSHRINVCSTALAEVFREKISVVSTNIQIPTDILLHPDEEIVYSFLRGYFDGDGHYSATNGSISGKTASKKLALQLQLLLARLGYPAHITVTRRKQSMIRGRLINNGNLVYEVRSTYKGLIERLGYGSPNKQWREYAFVHDDAIYVPLSGVKKSRYSGKVYNISTTDETFLVSNVVTHNCGSRWGKDRCMVMEFIQRFAEMLSEDRGPELVPTVYGWFVAPTYKMASQIWREFLSYFPREWVVDYWKSDYMISTINGGLIEVRSADDPDALVGVGLDIVQITEAARIKNLEEVWANLETRLMSPGRGPDGEGGIALINSTPKGAHTQFHRMFRWGQKDDPLYDPNWESWQFASFENPYLTDKDADFFERIKKRYPERIYRQEILAEFLADGQSVFPTAEECATYDGPETPEPGESYVIGWDPARSIDYSGVAIRNSKGQVVKVEQWSGKSWTTQVDLIEYYSKLYNYAHIVVDRTGLGETLPEALIQRGLSVEAIYFSNQEKEKMVNHLAMLIEQKAISYPNHPVLIAELKDYGYTLTASGNIKYGNSTKGMHDDLCTALFLCMKSYNLPEITIPWMGLLSGIKKR